MSVKTSNSGGDFEKAPEGMHVARCVRLIDCGTHLDEKWGKKKRVGWVFFELPNALMKPNKEGKELPFMVGKRYTLSHNEKALLRQDLESWYGKTFNTVDLDNAGGFDLDKLVGRPAMLNIVYSDDGKYANIKSINPLMQGVECPAQVNPSFIFSIDEAGSEKFETLSEKMKEYINQAEELKPKNNSVKTATTAQDFDDDIPF